MQEPIQEIYRGFDIQILWRVHDSDGRVETTAFIKPVVAGSARESDADEALRLSTVHAPGEEMPVAGQMRAAKAAVDAEIDRRLVAKS